MDAGWRGVNGEAEANPDWSPLNERVGVQKSAAANQNAPEIRHNREKVSFPMRGRAHQSVTARSSCLLRFHSEECLQHRVPFSWQATAMARASRPLFGARAAAGRCRMGKLLVRMSHELATGEGRGRAGAAYVSDSHCMASRLLSALPTVVTDVEDRLRPVELRRASARATFWARWLAEDRVLSL